MAVRRGRRRRLARRVAPIGAAAAVVMVIGGVVTGVLSRAGRARDDDGDRRSVRVAEPVP
jgi:hypothetical protein